MADKDLWQKCPSCNKLIYRGDWEANLWVCPECGYHSRIGVRERLKITVDEGTFEEFDGNVFSVDPLNFFDSKGSYAEKVAQTMKKTGLNEAVVVGKAKINGIDVVLGIMDFRFLGGSMGSVVGEKVTRAAEKAEKLKLPLVLVIASGGARMHEGILSLMQMAKTSAALKRFHESGGLYIAVLTDPTTGGVTASFAMLADVIIAEPQALIGFAGPRVIEQTIKQKLPKGFQRAEFLQDHGFVDMVVERKDLKDMVSKVIDFFTG